MILKKLAMARSKHTRLKEDGEKKTQAAREKILKKPGGWWY